MLVLITPAPSPARAEGPIAEVEQLLRTIDQTRDRDQRFHLADQAVVLCERAIHQRPKDPGPRIELVHALLVADVAHPEACRPGFCERALVELTEARKLDGNSLEAERIASEMGLVLSRLGRHPEALAEYDRALALVEPDRRPSVFDDHSRAVLYANSAETLMALGRLPEAIARYRQAEAGSTPGDLEWALAEWGLGVALDRDEQVDKARAAVQRALDYDPALTHLHDDSVFFEPPGDKWYYEALGHEVAGDREQAMAAWRAFLEASPGSRYAGRARAHLGELRRMRAPALPVDPGRLKVALVDLVDLHNVRSVNALGAVVRQHEDELKLCYARALRADRGARGELRLQILIDPTGWLVTRPRVLTSEVQSARLERCVELTAASWRFGLVTVPDPEEVLLTLEFAR